MSYLIITLVLAAINSSCVLINVQKTSETFQEISTSNISKTICTYQILREIYFCEPNTNNLNCDVLIKYNNDHNTLRNVLKNNINAINLILDKVLNLENKAIVCKGERYLLHIIMYVVFINNTLNGLIKKENSEIDIFNELFKTEMNISKVENRNRTQIIEDLRKSININKGDKENLYSKINRNQEEITKMQVDLIQNVRRIVQLILPFVTDPHFSSDFQKLYKLMVGSVSNVTTFFIYIFKEIKNMYKNECHPDLDVAVLFKSDDIEQIQKKNYTITLLVEKVNRLFVKVHDEFRFFENKFYPLKHNFSNEIPYKFFHVFNKYHFHEIWTLIGDEIVVDRWDWSSGATVSLNDVMLDKENEIAEMASQISTAINDSLKCRLYLFLNLMIKLHLYTVRVLMRNVHKIRQLIKTMSVNEIFQNYVKKTAENQEKFTILRTSNLIKIFNVLFDMMRDLETTNGPDDFNNVDLNDRKNENAADVDNELRSVFEIFSRYNAYIIENQFDVIENYTNEIDTKFRSMLYEMWNVSGWKVGETSAKWYKWAIKTYEDDCGPLLVTSESVHKVFDPTEYDSLFQVLRITPKMNIKLEWFITKMKEINDYLYNDLDKIFSS